MSTVTLEMTGNIATICFNRPEQLNAVNNESLTKLSQRLDEIKELTDITCVVLKSASPKAFVAGADISELQNMSTEEIYQFSKFGQQVMDKIQALPVPVICQIDGYTLGGGMEIALACDFRVATPRSYFGLPEITLGFIPGWGGTQRLARLIGYSRAFWLVTSGQRISGSQALELGIINELVEPEDLDQQVQSMVEKLSKSAPLAVKEAKRVMTEGLKTSLDEGVRLERDSFTGLFNTEDCTAGVAAFLRKEKIQFKGR